MTAMKKSIPAWKAARALGDEEAAKEVLRQAAAYDQANEKEAERRLDCRGDLTWARATNDVLAAKRAVVDSVTQKEAHTLAPEDLVWLVGELGTFRSRRAPAQAIAEWIYDHGPVHRPLVAAAEEIAASNDSECLDAVLLWVEPTPERWFEHASWNWGRARDLVADELKKIGRQPPTTISEPEELVIYKACVKGPLADHARRVLRERGHAAIQSLRDAPRFLGPGVKPKPLLEAWVEVLL